MNLITKGKKKSKTKSEIKGETKCDAKIQKKVEIKCKTKINTQIENSNNSNNNHTNKDNNSDSYNPQGYNYRTNDINIFKKLKNLLISITYLLYFVIFSFKELVISNITMYVNYFRNGMEKSAKYIFFKTSLSSRFKMNLLSHVITLTPGTIVVKCDYENKTLLIHCLFGDQASIIEKDIRNGLEKILSRV